MEVVVDDGGGITVPGAIRTALAMTADSTVDVVLFGAGLLVVPRTATTDPSPTDGD